MTPFHHFLVALVLILSWECISAAAEPAGKTGNGKNSPASAELPVPFNDAKSKTTRAAMAEFFSYYDDQLRQINEQPTAVTQEELERSLARKLDDKLRNQTWEFHCPISEVKDVGTSHFKISHGRPEEMDEKQPWSTRQSVTLLLSRQEAMALKPGDYIVYTGVPRFSSGDEFPGSEYFTKYFVRRSTATKQIIHLTSQKTKVQKALDSGGDNASK